MGDGANFFWERVVVTTIEALAFSSEEWKKINRRKTVNYCSTQVAKTSPRVEVWGWFPAQTSFVDEITGLFLV